MIPRGSENNNNCLPGRRKPANRHRYVFLLHFFTILLFPLFILKSNLFSIIIEVAFFNIFFANIIIIGNIRIFAMIKNKNNFSMREISHFRNLSCRYAINKRELM